MQNSKSLTEVLSEWTKVFMHRSGRDFKQFMDDTGLTFTQINLLMRILHGECLGVSDISKQMGFTRAAASQAVERLVQMGFLERREDPQDRRARRLQLTDAGRELIQKGIEARGKWIESITDSLTPEQQDMIISALTLLTEAARQTKD
jgi:DNA-binding MarR family transcriptional regulator